MNSELYQDNILRCIEQTKILPTSEIKYYLLLLLNSLKAKESTLTNDMVNELFFFLHDLDKILNLNIDKNQSINQENYTNYSELFDNLLVSYKRLIAISKTDRLPVKIGYGLLNLTGAILAFFTGIIGGLIGGSSGFCRGVFNFTNPFMAAGIGVATGYLLGAAIGFRIPKKIFKDELTRQLKFCLDGLFKPINYLQQSSHEILTELQDTEEQRVRSDYFDNNEEQFQQFLNSEIPYEICTLPAQFVSETLEGYLGHHSFIKININDKKPITLEFTTAQSDLSRKLSNTESRVASGEKIIEMIAFHNLLQQTHACTSKYLITKMKSGDVDCLSYVDKILTGAGQKATILRRFDGTENWVGKNIVRFFIEELSPFSQNILNDVTKEMGAPADEEMTDNITPK